MPPLPSRYVAIHIRDQSALVGAVDAGQKVVLKPRPIALPALGRWARENLRADDALVIDAPAEIWQLHDQLAPLVASVTITHPQLGRTLLASSAEADPRDAIVLARLHASGLVPALWVPPAHVRDARALVAHRRRLLAQRAEARTALHDLLRRYRLSPPGRDRLGADRREWWETCQLAPDDLVCARAALVSLNRVEPLLASAEDRLVRHSSAAPWQGALARLLATPGMSVLNATILLSAIGEIGRFPSSDQLVGYAGLGGRADTGGANDGRREIRAAMIDVAWAAIDADAGWRATFAELEQRLGRKRAIVATARRLLVYVWETLAAREIEVSGSAPHPAAQKGKARHAA
jgi:transposase